MIDPMAVALDGVVEAALPRRQQRCVEAWLEVFSDDGARACAALQLMASPPAVTSRMTDNLNVSTHVRVLVTDILILDDALGK